VQGRPPAPLELDEENWTSLIAHDWYWIPDQQRPTVPGMERIHIVGAGVAGLTAAIRSAEEGAPVTVHEAHAAPGGRARSSDGPHTANLGPHVLYADGPFFRWLKDRALLPRVAAGSLGGVRLRRGGGLHRTPPLALVPAVIRLRGRRAPSDVSFREWATGLAGAEAAEPLGRAAGVYTFHHDPGELSAAFVWERTVRTLLSPPPAARYVVGGWGRLVEALAGRAVALGVELRLGERVTDLPAGPVVVATELSDARALLRDDSLRWPSGHAVCLDLALRARRGDPFVVSDLDEAGWIERFSAPDPSLAPPGESLVQAQMPVRPGEDAEAATARLEALLDLAYDGWRERATWRRRLVFEGRSGALDGPGTTWRDRPAIDRGDGVLLAGDQVAAPGLLSEVAWASGLEAAERAVALARPSRPRLRPAA
jgi:phytoene dehydrogenase-like protein